MFNETIKYCKENNSELKWSNPLFLKKYAQLSRKIIANITYTPNATMVKENIASNKWPAYYIAGMTHEEMYPELYSELKSIVMAKYISKNNEQEQVWLALDWLKQNPPRELRTASIQDVIDWGMINWDITKIPNNKNGFSAPDNLE